MLNLTSNQRNENCVARHCFIPFRLAKTKKFLTVPRAGEDKETKASLCPDGRSINWYNHFRKQFVPIM